MPQATNATTSITEKVNGTVVRVTTSGGTTLEGTTTANVVGGLVDVQSSPYTLQLSDAGKTVRTAVGGTATVTVPPESDVPFTTGTLIRVITSGAFDDLQIAAGSGVQITAPNGLFVGGNGARIDLLNTGSNSWVATVVSLAAENEGSAGTPGNFSAAGILRLIVDGTTAYVPYNTSPW